MGSKLATAAGQGRSGRKPCAPAVLLAAAALLSGATTAQAQFRPPPVPVTQFDMTGFLQAATLDAPGDVLAGGTLMVNGQLVVVPRNTIVVMPATFLTWEQLFEFAPSPYGPAQSGLAMSDIPAPFVPYEVHVVGNRVVGGGGTIDRYIAALVYVSQQSINSGQGYVNFIDYSTGEFRVGGFIGDPTTGMRVRINDPLGKFGRASSPDPRFTIDEDNPTVRAGTGYPMCMPRTDPASGTPDTLCPEANRPRDPTTLLPMTSFKLPLLGPAPSGCTGAIVAGLQDPCLMAPLEVGDYVTYSGTLVKDGPEPSVGPNPALTPLNHSYVSAWSMVANVGIFTWPGTDPAYIATEVTILGTGGSTVAGAVEATTRTRFEGFTTDPSHFDPADPTCQDPAFRKSVGLRCSAIDLYGLDIDPCQAGVVTERPWGAIDVDQGPPTGAVAGRWRFRPPGRTMPLTGASGVFDPPPQQMRAKVRGAGVGLTKGPQPIFYGKYDAPITEYLFPENVSIGSPIVANNFESFPYLVNGLGQFLGAGGPVVGPITPWPGAAAPARTAPACAAPILTPPTAIASIVATPSVTSISVVSGQTVTLDGTASTGTPPLAFSWSQTSGPTLVPDPLNTHTAALPIFTAPVVAAPTVFTYSLIVTEVLNPGAPSAPSGTLTITVTPPTGVAPPAAVAAATPSAAAAGAIVVLNGSSSTGAAPLTFAWSQAPTDAFKVTIANPAAAVTTFTAPLAATALNFTLTVTDANLATSTASVTVAVSAPGNPVAVLGPSQTTLVNNLVTLDGSQSFDPNGLPLTFAWAQTGGPAVPLDLTNPARPTFTPTVPGNYAFTLVVSVNVGGTVLSSTTPPALPPFVTVTVLGGVDQVAIVSAVYRIGKQRLQVTATSNVLAASLFLIDPAYAGNPLAPNLCASSPAPAACIPMPITAGVPTAILVGVAEPALVTVQSNLGGVAQSPITRVR